MKRSKLAQFQIAVRRWFTNLGKLLQPKWLKNFNRSVRRGLIRLQKILISIIAPKWLRKTGQSVQKGLMKAEATVARTGEKVSQSVAKSAVGTGAKKITRVGRMLEWRIFTAFGYIGKIIGGLIPAPVRRAFVLFGQAFWRVFGVFFVFLGRWFRTRHYWHLVGGVPAFVLALPLAYCMVRLPFYSADKKAVHYRRAAQKALLADDHKAANLYYKKLHQLGAMNELAEYQAATNMFLAGDDEAAFTAMKKLAPEGEPGFPPAHVWVARWYFDGRTKLGQEEAVELGEKHLAYALERDPDNPDARALRALRRSAAGDYETAIAELRRIVQEVPQQGVALAQLYAQHGRWEQAKLEVERVLESYQQKMDNGSDLTPQDYVIWSFADSILGNQDAAVATLALGYENHTSNRELRDQYYEKLLAHATTNYRSRHGEPQSILDNLVKAWKIKPDDETPMILLGKMSKGNDQFAQAARKTATDLLNSDRPPADLYRVMGTYHAGEENYSEAIRFLKKAVEHDPRDSYSLNNLAHCLMTQNSAYEDALKMVNRALEIEPDQALYRETRGQLLMKLGRYQDAVQELNFALNGLGETPELHSALANCYEQLGQAELAAIHRSRAL